MAKFAKITVDVSDVKKADADYTAKLVVDAHGTQVTWEAVPFKVTKTEGDAITVELTHEFKRTDFGVGKPGGRRERGREAGGVTDDDAGEDGVSRRRPGAGPGGLPPGSSRRGSWLDRWAGVDRDETPMRTWADPTAQPSARRMTRVRSTARSAPVSRLVSPSAGCSPSRR